MQNGNGTPWRAMLGMPGYDLITGGAALGFWMASRTSNVVREYTGGSLLANNFNRLWVHPLNARHRGEKMDYFAMQHADVEPEPFWFDKLVAELEATNLDVLGVVVPIKDGNGLTSCAINNGEIVTRCDSFSAWLDELGINEGSLSASAREQLEAAYVAKERTENKSNWRVKCRITTTEVLRLPATFTSEDVGGPLLLNTGLWVCKFNPEWAKKVHFTINDRIVFDAKTDQYYAEVEPEDWYFSRLCHELGLKIGATRKVKLVHRGQQPFVNYISWGNAWDKEYVSESTLPIREDRPYHESIEGYFDYDHLYDEIAETVPDGGQFVEIGTWRGKSLAYMLDALKRREKSVSVWGVDHYAGSPEANNLQQMAQLHDIHAECEKNLRPIGYPFRLIKSKSVAAAEQFADGSLDAVFIDGGHEYPDVSEDIKAWKPKVKPGGILAGHDLQMRGVCQAVQELVPDAQPFPRTDFESGFEWGLCWKARV